MLELSKYPKYITFLYSCFAVLPPPTKLELKLAGKAKEEQSARAGSYILADGLVNGYPHWLQTSEGSQAIWYGKVSSAWFVAPKKFLGTNSGFIAGPNGKDSYPNEIKQGWKYADPAFEPWQDAGHNDVIFKAIGTFFKPLLYSINYTFSPS